MCLVAPGLYQGAEFSRKILELQKLSRYQILMSALFDQPELQKCNRFMTGASILFGSLDSVS